MESNSDVISELFGKVSLTDLTTALEPEIDDLLWELREQLGNKTYSNIRRDQQPAKALIHAILGRHLDKRLIDSFRDYVLSSDGLDYLITPEAKPDAHRRRMRIQVCSDTALKVEVDGHALKLCLLGH